MIKISGTHAIHEIDSDQLEIECDDSQVSDGYHTFGELYDHRCLLFLNLCVMNPETSWKSKVQSDGNSHQNWFIAGIEVPNIGQITYHIPMKFWHSSVYIKEHEYGMPWDGHTSENVIERLENMLKK